MGCDVFSLLGVGNIAQWLDGWSSRYVRSIEACTGAGFAQELKKYEIQEDPSKVARFIGYTVQQYITKSTGGTRRATSSYEKIRTQIQPTVQSKLGRFMAPHITVGSLQLPDVPHMYSLVPLAQSASCPIHRLTSSHGLAGAQPQQKELYTTFIQGLGTAILTNAGIGAGIQ
jgi:hypothetical protein